jgi:RimJ/RimL family protein N-acetyltransferase
MIRPAVEADIPRLVEMGRRFLASSPYSKFLPENPESMRVLIAQLVGWGTLLVSEAEGNVTGMIGFMVFNHPMSGEKIGGEIFWWVDPEARGIGLELLKQAEQAVREAGGKKMQMIAPDEGIEKLYQRLGYSQVETTYQRSLV